MKRIIFDVGRWPCFLHREARGLELAAPSDSPLRRLEDELFEKLYAGDAELLADKDQDSKWAGWAHAIHTACEQLPAFNRLADDTRGDADASALGVEELMAQLKPIIDEQNANQPQEETVRRLVREGAEAASAAVEEYRDAAAGLQQVMFGAGASGEGKRGVDDRKIGLARRLRADPRLKRIAQTGRQVHTHRPAEAQDQGQARGGRDNRCRAGQRPWQIAACRAGQAAAPKDCTRWRYGT
jgi:hypothetical protein